MSESKRTKIDELLRQIASLQCNIGIDSTEHERLICKAKQGVLIQQIKAIDKEYFETIKQND